MATSDDPRNAALTLLARRDFSRGELRQRLLRKTQRSYAGNGDSRNGSAKRAGVDPEGGGPTDSVDPTDPAAIESVLDELEAHGELCDERFVASFTRSRLRRGQGPLRIRHDLAVRGVDAELIDQHLTFTTAYWIERVLEVRARRFGDALPQSAAERGRQGRFLAQRGFPSDVIFAAFKSS